MGFQEGDLFSALSVPDARGVIETCRNDAAAVRAEGRAVYRAGMPAQRRGEPRHDRPAGELAFELTRRLREHAPPRWIGLQREPHRAVELLVFQRVGGETGIDQRLAPGGIPLLPQYVAEHGEQQHRDAGQQPPDPALEPRRDIEQALAFLDILALGVGVGRFRRLAGGDERTVQLRRLRIGPGPTGSPCLRLGDVVARQQPGGGPPARVPTLRQVAVAGVIADPVEVLVERVL